MLPAVHTAIKLDGAPDVGGPQSPFENMPERRVFVERFETTGGPFILEPTIPVDYAQPAA